MLHGQPNKIIHKVLVEKSPVGGSRKDITMAIKGAEGKRENLVYPAEDIDKR
jgi:hypothetical protein